MKNEILVLRKLNPLYKSPLTDGIYAIYCESKADYKSAMKFLFVEDADDYKDSDFPMDFVVEFQETVRYAYPLSAILEKEAQFIKDMKAYSVEQGSVAICPVFAAHDHASFYMVGSLNGDEPYMVKVGGRLSHHGTDIRPMPLTDAIQIAEKFMEELQLPVQAPLFDTMGR